MCCILLFSFYISWFDFMQAQATASKNTSMVTQSSSSPQPSRGSQISKEVSLYFWWVLTTNLFLLLICYCLSLYSWLTLLCGKITRVLLSFFSLYLDLITQTELKVSFPSFDSLSGGTKKGTGSWERKKSSRCREENGCSCSP